MKISHHMVALVLGLSPPHARAAKTLVVGDSLTCGPFGKSLLQKLDMRGRDVVVDRAISSGPANWLNGEAPRGRIC